MPTSPPEGRTKRELYRDMVTEGIRNEDLVTASLLCVAVLLGSLYLAIAIDIPAAEALLQMPL